MGEPMVHCCLVVLRDYARKCSELAWDCRGFCKRWQQKWFLSASSALWLRGTMPGKIINWLGVVVDSAHGHEMLAQIYCKLRMQHSGVLKPSIPEQWSQGRGVSNARALPWATPWLQPVV